MRPSCVVCGRGADLHHILTRKAYPEYINEPWNLMPLCREHHTEIHMKGLNYMASKYLKVRLFLEANGWEFEKGTKEKYWPPIQCKRKD